jgi:hypothetical protein
MSSLEMVSMLVTILTVTLSQIIFLLLFLKPSELGDIYTLVIRRVLPVSAILGPWLWASLSMTLFNNAITRGSDFIALPLASLTLSIPGIVGGYVGLLLTQSIYKRGVSKLTRLSASKTTVLFCALVIYLPTCSLPVLSESWFLSQRLTEN